MKKLYIPIVLLAACCIWLEIKPIKEYDLFFGWRYEAPFWVLLVLSVIFLLLNRGEYHSTRKASSFTPFLVCIISCGFILFHKKKTERLDNSPLQFEARNHSMGSDGGVFMMFKKNGYLVVEKQDHWMLTLYRGSYTLKHDTVHLDISLNFKLGREAVLTNDSLHFTGSNNNFSVVYPGRWPGK